MQYTLDLVNDAVDQHAAIRRVRRLQPAGGKGDKIFPPTYPPAREVRDRNRDAPPVHVFETRCVNGKDVECVLIDSVQAQANRMEEALLAATRAGRFPLPMFAVQFDSGSAPHEGITEIGTITSLEAPHRVFDAILRDSEIDGRPFRATQWGRSLLTAKLQRAAALFETAPTALVFGAWNSTGEGGGLGAKFPRCLISEVVGVDARRGNRTGSRIDPLGSRKEVKVFAKDINDWSVVDEDKVPTADKKYVLKPSKINHGNIAPSVQPLGVTIDYAQHTVVITLAGLRRLSFPLDGETASPAERDRAARSALAALAVVAVTEQDRAGYALRSRCDLVPEHGSGAGFELVRADGSTETLELDASGAIAVLNEAVEQARRADLSWQEAPIILTPQARLVELVQRSRALALAGKAEPEDED